MRPDSLESMRVHIAQTIQHATALIEDLDKLDDRMQMLMPSLGELTDAERAEHVASLCGFDQALPERLRQLVESLADVLAGLTTSDGGMAWLEHQLARLETGEDPTE
jgi:hypothetical protein